MPIRFKPFDEITASDAQSLIERQIREDRTLDFKQQFDLSKDRDKRDLLLDVTALANAEGGTLLYGAVEGEGEDRGLIVDLRGMALLPDQTQLTVSNLLRDGVDEPLPGVLHRALLLQNGTYLYVIRVPSSFRAPHSFRFGSSRHNFYARATVSNEPMTARQIKDLALRATSARERITMLIERRSDALRRIAASREQWSGHHGAEQICGPDYVALHVLPLAPPDGGMDLGDMGTYRRLAKVPPPGRQDRANGSERMTLEGLYNETPYRDSRGPGVYTLHLREGGIEFFRAGIAAVRSDRRDAPRVLNALKLEKDILASLTEAAALTDACLLNLPVAISLRLFGVSGVFLESTAGRMPDFEQYTHPFPQPEILIEPVVVSAWGADADRAIRRLLDTVWQAAGYLRCFHYDEAGVRSH